MARRARPTVEPIALRVSDVAALLDCDRSTVYELLYSGQIRGFKLGEAAGWRVLRSDLERWIAERSGK